MPHDPRSGPSTRAVHAGRLDNPYGALSSPIYQNATFRFPSLRAMTDAFHAGGEAMVYTRYANPTISACEAKLASVEGAEAALAFASGMAAITSVFFDLLRPGDRVLCQREVYGGTFEFLSHWAERVGWHVDWYGIDDEKELAAGLAKRPKVVYAESPANPLLRVADLKALASRAHAAGAALVVDNTFAGGVLQQPLALGADVVVHSATKYMGGHSDVIAGCAMGTKERMKSLWKVRKLLGGCIDPHAAWLLERSLKTLPLRVERCSTSAAAVAEFLAAQPGVESVRYPGLPSHPDHGLAASQMKAFGAMITIEVAGGAEAAERFVDSLRVFMLAPSLGGAESLVSVPATSSHFALTAEERKKAGVTDGMVRLSVGLEDAADLIADVKQALANATSAVSARARAALT
jgi:cystathionine beta-lyase/cystathionine gamma-synthase